MDVSSLVTAIGGVLTIALTIGAGARYVGRRLTRVSDQWDDFKGDWYGQPARPGREAQPGVMERLGKIEAAIADTRLTDRVNDLERRMDDLIRIAPRS